VWWALASSAAAASADSAANAVKPNKPECVAARQRPVATKASALKETSNQARRSYRRQFIPAYSL